MAREKRRTGERRWIVLAADGRHATLGRDTDPTEEQIAAAEQGLAAEGLGGWLAVSEGDYWTKRRQVNLLAVRTLGSPAVAFEEAAAAFEAARQAR